MSTTAANIYSICPATSDAVHDNAEFIVVAPKEGSFSVQAEADQKEAESRKQSGTAGPSSITGYKTSGALGEFKWQQRLDGHTADDYLFRAAIHADETWKTIAAASHKVPLTGATYTVATGLLDLTTLSGTQPVNMKNGWAVRIWNPTTKKTFVCEVTEQSAGSNIWVLEPAPDNTLPASLTADWEMASEFVKEGLTRLRLHVKADYTDTTDQSAHYFQAADVTETKFGFAVKDDVRVTYTLTGSGNAHIKTGGAKFPGEAYVYPEAHPTVVTSVEDLKMYINGVNQTGRCAVASATITFARGTKDKERIGVAGGSCGNVLKNIDVTTEADVAFEDSDLFIASAANAIIGLLFVLPPSDDVGYAINIPSNTVKATYKDNDGEGFIGCTFKAQNNDELGFQSAFFRFRP